jgi:muconolactone delta-isomerase
MQFIAINKRNADKFSADEIGKKVPLEVLRVRELYAEGFVRQIWHRADIPGGVLLIEAENEDAVRSRLRTLPMVQAGMVEVAMVVPLKPFAGFGPPPA